MTTIIGVQKKGKVFLGHDSQATYPWGEKISLRDGKIVKSGRYTFGVAGHGGFPDVLADADLPVVEGDTRKFVRRVLAPEVARLEKEAFGEFVSACLVVVNGEVFEYAQGRIGAATSQGVYGVGSGSEYAVGYLLGLRRSPLYADVKRSLVVAASRDSYTSGPFTVQEVR